MTMTRVGVRSCLRKACCFSSLIVGGWGVSALCWLGIRSGWVKPTNRSTARTPTPTRPLSSWPRLLKNDLDQPYATLESDRQWCFFNMFAWGRMSRSAFPARCVLKKKHGSRPCKWLHPYGDKSCRRLHGAYLQVQNRLPSLRRPLQLFYFAGAFKNVIGWVGLWRV